MQVPTADDLERFKSLSYSDQQQVLGKLRPEAKPYFDLVARPIPDHNWTAKTDKNAYNKARNAALTKDSQDIGAIPFHGIQWDHRERSRTSLKYHLEYYHGSTFNLPWASYHRELIEAFERSAINSEWLAFACPRGGGKALALETLLPTPSGWTTMGQVSVGDCLLDETGEPTKVTAKSPLDLPDDCYAIHFGNGARIVADARHQWLTTACDVTTIRTTQQVVNTFGVGHSVTLRDDTKVPITAVERVQSEVMQCVEVDSPNSMYLCSEHRIPTHNSKLTECAAEWMVLHGLRRFVLIVGATDSAGAQRLGNIKKQLQLNKLLRRDFPEVCYPIFKLGGKARKAEGQHVNGLSTAITWNSNLISFPTVQYPPDWKYPDVSGGVLACAGLTGNLRGWSVTTEDLEDLRPDLAIADDPQTRASAKSAAQVESRLSTLTGDLAFLGGPTEACCVVVPCTVIYKNDLADKILNKEIYPEWHSIRKKMLSEMPVNDEAVQKYIAFMKDCLRNDQPNSVRNAYYLEHQAEIEEGAVATWPERYDRRKEEVSAIQHAIHLMARSMEAFFAEGQNEPYVDPTQLRFKAAPEVIMNKMTELERGKLPEWAEHVCSYIDVQQDCLFYVTGVASSNFRGVVCDYGSYPGQSTDYFELGRLGVTLTDAYPKASTDEARIIAGVRDFIADMADRSYTVHGTGRTLKHSRILIDVAHWDDAVMEGVRESGVEGLVLPSRGVGIDEDKAPMSAYKKRPGETHGHYWLTKATPKMDKQLQMDTNYWMSFAHQTMLAQLGDPGSWALWKADPKRHMMFADHLNAEIPEEKTSERFGRKKVVWSEPPHAQNHLSDCYRGMLAGMSTLGCMMQTHFEAKEETEAEANQTRQRGRGKIVKVNRITDRSEVNRMLGNNRRYGQW